MRLRILLFLMLLSASVVNAADTIRYLIISEARLDRADNAYVEITNVGTKPVQLSDFELGKTDPYGDPFKPGSGNFFRLPSKILEPGKSLTFASIYDWTNEMWKKEPEKYNKNGSKPEWLKYADIQIHQGESPTADPTDSISPNRNFLGVWGRDCYYLEQHLSATDSVVVDQVGGVFDGANGRLQEKGYDVAGVVNATRNAVLVRKFNVKTGNINFASARGIGIDDSEWIPIPFLFQRGTDTYEPDRAVFWTTGNHGDYKLDANSLKSATLVVDWAKKTITAPWGTRNNDEFMAKFTQSPGLAWHYDLSAAREDSAFQSARTGDKISIYACGNTLQKEIFNIVVSAPKVSDNMVIPKFASDPNGFYNAWINTGTGGSYFVTENLPGMDTITTFRYAGIPYATSIDTLFKYLEKAPKAKWEIVWVDGVKRTSVISGDKLKVTAENGAVKQYFIKVYKYVPSRNAYLSSITWPDIPEDLKGLYGWIGDTIPNFGQTAFNYKFEVPNTIESIPALVAKTASLNSSVEVKRATTLNGTNEQKTINFKVTAEDQKTTYVYSVEMNKEKNPENIQPYKAEPFISEVVFKDQYSNGFIEITNPGNQPLDLSNYLITYVWAQNPVDAITWNSASTEWAGRYQKYVPGYKWVNEANWSVNPGTLVQDLNVNPIVLPGDVFVMGHIKSTGTSGYPWNASRQSDVEFGSRNPWGETTGGNSAANASWCNHNIYLFKILNDSVRQGLKAANNPIDFELIEVFGAGDGSNWNIAGVTAGDQCETFIRKPEFTYGKPNYKESFGTTKENSEWISIRQRDWQAIGTGWPAWRLNCTLDLGKHSFKEVTDYKSTITSVVYKVSEGYSIKETLRGVRTGTTVATVLNSVVKANPGQTLSVKSKTTGAELKDAATVSLGDTLIVLSKDSINTTKYIMNVTAEGLSSDALLTSNKYKVVVSTMPSLVTDSNAAAVDGIGKISGMEYGTELKTVVSNLKVPAGATMTMINSKGAYVPLTILNFDTAYVSVTVNHDIILEVVAENGITKIKYELSPEISQSSAFVTSDVYSVSQKDKLIDYVPRGTSTKSLISNLTPSLGASMKLVDKLGKQRIDGTISADDKIVITSPNGSVTTVYYISHLSQRYIPETTYLAYVLSNLYLVDQVNYTISGATGKTLLTEFNSGIIPCIGSAVSIIDKNGVVRNTGDLNDGDKLRVVSKDGKITVDYTLKLDLTSVDLTELRQIELYPNPTNGSLNVNGVTFGDRIQVYNSTGVIIRDIKVENNLEVVSLHNQPAGLYLIIISENDKQIGRYKAVKQ